MIQEVEELGGMAKAIETGMPKMRIEEAAARRQARIDSGKEIIVGVNAYQAGRRKPRSMCCEVDNTRGARSRSLRRLAEIAARRATRRRCEEALAALTAAARNRRRAICWSWPSTAARARATLGEISDGAGKGVRAATRP